MMIFRDAVEAGDHAGMVAAVAPDVLLHSPVTHRPLRGRAEVASMFAALLEVCEDFRYTDELYGPVGTGTEVLVFRARVGDREVEGMDLIRYDDDGRIEELTVTINLVSGLSALAEHLAVHLSVRLAA
jgi:hypothetical protein